MSHNCFLNYLADRGLFTPAPQPYEFKQGKVLFSKGSLVTHVFFPFDAVISLIVRLENGASVEAAMVGRDGIAGGLAAADGKVSLQTAIVQLPGKGLAVSASAFRAAVAANDELRECLLKHEQALQAQSQQSAACNIAHHLEARLAKWMLRARDLSNSNDMLFTQEFIAEMLGVGRTSVSVTAHRLQELGVIRYSRGRVTIVNVEALRKAACECYDAVYSIYDQLWTPVEPSEQRVTVPSFSSTEF